MKGIMQCLRPLVEDGKWDYLVVWELGDDPSSFIQWVGCCCSGAHGVCENVKEETKLVSLCRDGFFKHSAKSKACRELSTFPTSIPLYSGIHGETVVSTETWWLSSSTSDSSSNLGHELPGTRVLIPVAGGLVELFTTRNVPKDEKVIEFVTSRCKIKMDDEVIAAQSYPDTYLNAQPLKSFFDHHSPNGAPLLKHINLTYGPKVPIIPTPSQLTTYPSLEGSFTGSNMCVSANHNALIEREHLALALKMEKEPYQSKNLITERKRRNRIKDGLLALRSLVPNISKMDKASILVDAVAYIEELHKEIKQLEDDLKDTTNDENKKKTDPVLFRKSDSEIVGNPKERNRDQLSAHETKQIPVQIEVNQIETRAFRVKLVGAHKQGGFMRLIEGLFSLDLQVIDVNTTTFDGKMMNIFTVEVTKTEVQSNILKESLIKLMSNLH